MCQRGGGMLLIAAAIALAGCSALIAGGSTSERSIVGPGVSKADVSRKLGGPVSVEALTSPVRASDLQLQDAQVVLLAPREYVFDAEVGHKVAPSSDWAVSLARFRFQGRLGNDHLVGETVSLNLMTFGMAELFLIPSAIKQRAGQEELQLAVWFDASDKAVAYRWSRPATAQPR